MRHDIVDYLKTVICTLAPLERDKIGIDHDIFSDLGIDSISVLQILAAIEKDYGIKLNDWDLNNYNTISKIVAKVESCLDAEVGA